MKKFIVRYTKKNLFRKNGIAVFEQTFDHAVDAWRWAKALKADNAIEGRWPILSLEIILQ